jgi:hypothetical protein
MTALAAGLGSLALAGSALAEGGLTLEERVERLERRAEMPGGAPVDLSGIEKRLDALEAHIKNLPFGLKIGGMIVTSYAYDFNQPDSRRVSLRGFDPWDNTFSLDLFQLQLSRAPGDGDGVGFLTKVDFGKTANRLGEFTDWNGDGVFGDSAEETNDVELQEAYVTYNFPGLPDFQILGGKFATPIGMEVIESPLNYNISRALQFTWAGPFTHVGATASYAFAPEFSMMLGIVNGWDNVIDSNDGKSVIGAININPVPEFGMKVAGLYGAEQPDRGDSKRGLVDVGLTIKPIENLALLLEYIYGNESDIVPGTAEWNSFSGVVAYDIPDLLAVPIGFALRGEYFDDSDGTRLPFYSPRVVDPPPAFAGWTNAWEITFTSKVVLAKGLMFRAEYRYDRSANDQYERQPVGLDRFQQDQHTVAGELSYVF